MKVIIQIPCFNEAETLPVTLAALPKQLPGVDQVEYLVIDDGSCDGTAEVARAHGVEHIVRHSINRGLACAFVTGIHACLWHGADIIVNTDADNQYLADDIAQLIHPIIEGRADMVVGCRPIEEVPHFSWLKKKLQKVGSFVVRMASQTHVEDATSGFRAFSRSAALRLNVFSEYTYTLETIIQAGQKCLSVVSVPIRVNKDLRPSRLMRGMFDYIRKSLGTIIRIFVVYRPMRFFVSIGSVPFFFGFVIGLRFLFHFAMGEGGGRVQSLILASLLMTMGFFMFLMAFVADLIAVNRKLLEQLIERFAFAEDSQDGKNVDVAPPPANAEI